MIIQHIRRLLITAATMFLIIHFSIPAYAEVKEDLRIHSEAAILIDAATGEVLYEKNAKVSMYPASITKIITGIIAIEDGDLFDIVTVSQNARNVDGTRVYLVEGEQVSLLKLVHGLLINSGNDAGIAIAEHFDQSEEAFAKRMNQFVMEKVGVSDSHFMNPHGLFHSEHKTTAYDMAMITRYAMKNNIFRMIVGTKQMEWVGEGWETTLYNHNKLLWRYEGATGVKNGYVSQSGHTLVSSVKREERELIAVTLKANSSENAYQDMEDLFDYGFSLYAENQKERELDDKNEEQDINVNKELKKLEQEPDNKINRTPAVKMETKIETDNTGKIEHTNQPQTPEKLAISPITWFFFAVFILILIFASIWLIRKYRLKKIQKRYEMTGKHNRYWG
jgi:D-alanyl-D-alanine carboxypeptidase